MIKKLLNKIIGLFTKKEEVVPTNNCPYKLEPKPVGPLVCEHCNKELKGKESAEDEDGAMYKWCKNCNYINKIKLGKIIGKPNTPEEALKAFKLFKSAGHVPSSYSLSEKGEKHKL